MILLAWWDTAFSIWMYWVGLARFAMVVCGWLFTLGRLALKLCAEATKQLVILPFNKMTGQMLPVLHVAAALLNFAMILVTGKPVFAIPFKSLKDVIEARELLPVVRWETKKVPS